MTATRLLQTGQIETAAGGIPELLLPPANLFYKQSQRFHQLAQGHSLSDYLLFLAALTEGQQKELDRHPEIPLPDAYMLSHCSEHGMPPLAPAGWHRQPHWLEIFRTLVKEASHALPVQGKEIVSSLLKAGPEWLEAQAEHLLHGQLHALDLAAAPFTAAALQVQWTYLAHKMDQWQAKHQGLQPLCPLCGSHPTAAVIKTDGASQGLRYLHCALCGSEWHVVRSECSQCGNAKGISYYSIKGTTEAVRAEACQSCRSYLKVVLPEKDAQVDPVADDIATLALDLLMDEKDLAKSGINYLMLPEIAHP